MLSASTLTVFRTLPEPTPPPNHHLQLTGRGEPIDALKELFAGIVDDEVAEKIQLLDEYLNENNDIYTSVIDAGRYFISTKGPLDNL